MKWSYLGKALILLTLVGCYQTDTPSEEASDTLLSPPTEIRSIVTVAPDTLSPTLTETGHTIVVASDTPAASTEIPRLTPTPRPAACTQTRILVAGKPVSGETTDFGYYLVCVDGSSVEMLTPGRPYYYDPSVSPINRLVAFTTEYREIAVLDLSGNVVQVIKVGHPVRSPSWSPDEAFIAYIRDTQFLEVVHLETGIVSESLIPPDFRHPQMIEPGFENVDWSPDGKHIALNTNYDSLFVLDVNCSAESYVCSSQNFHLLADRIDGEFSWSPDSEKVAVEYLGGVNYVPSLRIIDLQGRLIREYSPTELKQYTSLEFNVDLELLQSPVWSPDGSEIAFSDARDIWILSLADNSLFNLTRELIEIDSVAMMAWAP